MKFSIGARPISTETPTVVVDGGVALGTHSFRLVVVDDSGLVSTPATVTVNVVEVGTTPPIFRPAEEF